MDIDLGYKIIVAGSRSIRDPELVYSILDKYKPKIAELVCGMAVQWKWHVDPLAGGVDRFAHDWAVMNQIKIAPFPADWNKYGSDAGFRRNAQMGAYGRILIAIWDGKSTGTEDMIKTMRRNGKHVIIHDLSQQEGLPFE